MATVNPSTQPTREIKIRVTELMHKQLTEECGHCLCSLNAFARNALAKEILSRRANRRAASDHAVLAGQLGLEVDPNA
jgi:hypothetical protein